jgi:hypothetical protein
MNNSEREIKINILNQAYDESRYHRNFHQILFSLSITIFTSLLGLQVSYNFIKEMQLVPLIIFISGFYIILPAYFVKMIADYHLSISKLNIVINNLTEELIKSFDSDFTYNSSFVDVSPSIFKSISFYKYREKIDKINFEMRSKPEKHKKHIERKINVSLLGTGRGHKFFIFILLTLVIANILITVVYSPLINF